MKDNKLSFLWGIVIIESFLLLAAGVFLYDNHLDLFQKDAPSALVIDVFGEVISTVYPGMFEADLRGERGLDTYPVSATEIVKVLRKYEDDNSIKAFILQIDSNGGDSHGQDELVRQIHLMKKPVVAVIKDQALSSGYYVSAGTDRIFANELSNIADIGITTFIEYRRGNENYSLCRISSSEFKKMYFDDCPGLDQDLYQERKIYVDSLNENMAFELAYFRNLPLQYVLQLADGTIFNGRDAVRLGLVDEIGGIHDAKEWLEEKVGTELEILYWREVRS